MPLYHIVLAKPKPEVTSEQVADLLSQLRGMVGKIPGLRSFECNNALPSTAQRAQGFTVGVVALLEKAEDLQPYTDHPAHAPLHDAGHKLFEDVLAFDLEFQE